ncbi:hypothetical protein E1B22_12565 (plasmid) [Thermaerobacter sp. FW80]|uniref:helix-turn-helix domain-containing protein n=1 Tax=Thermaerobacter sp. FW80 TaxID=2546351 RepID=UPI001074ACF9|nr:helix-turn-helix domain-containing protein [Thermaerobacter sp. FW80]QBS38739.1 hypothetical protein E1B22_12565 [Thermaerobacter sp. FW80]
MQATAARRARENPIRAIRRALGMSRRDFGRLVRVDPSYLLDLEGGRFERFPEWFGERLRPLGIDPTPVAREYEEWRREMQAMFRGE